jgi:hypothetical protein
MRAAALMLVWLMGCREREEQPLPDVASAAPRGAVEIIEVPGGDEPIQAIALREAERARAEGRDLLLYVGAPWCEPCQRFHDAVKRGELDATFPRLRLLELDRDRDEARLGAAGCLTRLIPLFAAVTAEGRCDPRRQMMGSIKGPGAVAEITPRLRVLLAPTPDLVDTGP